MTVNITCPVCDGGRLCVVCRAAAARLERAGYHVEHSSRYAALRAAATGTYGFDACIVPVGAGERAVADAAAVLFSGKRLALVMEDGIHSGARASAASSGAHLIDPNAFAAGEFSIEWLRAPGAAPARIERVVVSDASPETAASVGSLASDQSQATRRLKRVADAARVEIATAGLPAVPRLDLVAVLEDEIAWARASNTTFAIVLLHLPGVSSQSRNENAEHRERRLAAAEATIAGALRSSDVIAGGADDFLAVLGDADETGARLVMQRAARAVQASGLRPGAAKRRRGARAWSAGYATYPADGTARDTLLARATARLLPLESFVD